MQQRRRQLYSEVAEEKERLGQQAARCAGRVPRARRPVRPAPLGSHAPGSPSRRQRAELDELREQLQESSAAGVRALRAEVEKEREAQEQRHQVRPPARPGGGPAPPRTHRALLPPRWS